jgi:ectoine hydroxylase-related dioxygenase (phytanoyl-CoA dioxygenase family)
MSDTRRLVLRRQEDLYRGDLAGRHKQIGLEARAPDADALEAFDRDGYVVLKGLLTGDRLEELKAVLHTCLGPEGRNSFEGFKTQRAYALLAKSARLGAFAAHPAILGFLKARLHDQPLLSAFLAINIGPGEAEQIAHHDDGFYLAPRPGPLQGLSVIWAVDPFTAETGATRVWPGSHRWPAGRSPGPDDRSHQALMEPGDAIVFHGGLWHAGGANTTADQYRLAVTAQYCAPWLRTQENMSLAVPPEIVAELEEPLPSLLGYQIHPPFMGHVNGMHPRRLLEEADAAPRTTTPSR